MKLNYLLISEGEDSMCVSYYTVIDNYSYSDKLME